MHNYEYLLENLINQDQMNSNLRRTIKKGLISKLNKKQVCELALKYFGVDENGNFTSEKNDIVAYKCPYTGEIITNMDDITLDHIIAINNGGGTILFNCIPISSKANSSKGSNFLLSWLYKKNYFDLNRFKLLICYILDAYTKVFEKYDIEKSGFLFEEHNDINELNIQGDLQIDKREQAKVLNQNNNDKYTYLQFITMCINLLESYSKNINDDETINNLKLVLKNLQSKGVFTNIDLFQEIENILLKELKELTGEETREYITYYTSIDIYKLMNSFKGKNYKEELHVRIKYINEMLKNNNLSMLDYLKSIDDIDSFNLIYKDKEDINDNEIYDFIENIIINHETKIKIFIDMLNHGNIDILKQHSTEKFTTYLKENNDTNEEKKEYGTIGNFWHNNKEMIQKILYESEKDNPDYNVARDTLDYYFMYSKGGRQSQEGNMRRIKIFIEMLNHGNVDILNSKSSANFTTYEIDKNGNEIEKEYDKVKSFFLNNKEKINNYLYEVEKDNPDYNIARNTLDYYYMMTTGGHQSKEGIRRRLYIFIEMLNHGDIDILYRYNDKKFTTYEIDKNKNEIKKEYGKIKKYYTDNKEKIENILFQLEKDNPYYNTARNTLNYYNNMMKSQEGNIHRIEMFIEMLNHGNANILEHNSNEKFTTYLKDENGNEVKREYDIIGNFFEFNKDKIEKILFQLEKDNFYYNTARDILDNYYITGGGTRSQEGNMRRIKIFIEMLNHGNINILHSKSTEKFTVYLKDDNGNEVKREYDKIGEFWFHKSNRKTITKFLYETEKDNPYYDTARKTLDYYYMHNKGGHNSEEGLKRHLNIFIDMLNRGNTGILRQNSTEKFTIYLKDDNGNEVKKEYETIGSFWHRDITKNKILKFLYETEKDNPYYNTARNTLDYYYIVGSGKGSIDGNMRRIKIFIDMLNHGNINILKQNSTEKFTIYLKDENGNETKREFGSIGDYWSNGSNKDKIIKFLYETEKDNPYYNTARNTLDYYYIVGSGKGSIDGNMRRIKIFINMLNHGNFDILNSKSSANFTTYSKDNNGNQIKKEYGTITNFWYKNKDAIQQILYETEKDNPDYNNARNTLDNYYMFNKGGKKSEEGRKRRIEIFVDMLNHGITDVLNTNSSVNFTTFEMDENKNEIKKEYDKVGQFWSRESNKKVIIKFLFFDKRDSHEFDIARNNILVHLNKLRKKDIPEYKTIEDYLTTLDQTKKEVKELIELRNDLIQKKEELEQEVIALSNTERKGRAI